jgi:hypothetical protein
VPFDTFVLVLPASGFALFLTSGGERATTRTSVTQEKDTSARALFRDDPGTGVEEFDVFEKGTSGNAY